VLCAVPLVGAVVIIRCRPAGGQFARWLGVTVRSPCLRSPIALAVGIQAGGPDLPVRRISPVDTGIRGGYTSCDVALVRLAEPSCAFLWWRLERRRERCTRDPGPTIALTALTIRIDGAHLRGSTGMCCCSNVFFEANVITDVLPIGGRWWRYIAPAPR